MSLDHNETRDQTSQIGHAPRGAVQFSPNEPWAPPPDELAGGMRLARWRKVVGISRTTAWRWVKTGKLPVVYRYGIPFLTAKTMREFFVDDGSKRRSPKRTSNGINSGSGQAPAARPAYESQSIGISAP